MLPSPADMKPPGRPTKPKTPGPRYVKAKPMRRFSTSALSSDESSTGAHSQLIAPVVPAVDAKRGSSALESTSVSVYKPQAKRVAAEAPDDSSS